MPCSLLWYVLVVYQQQLTSVLYSNVHANIKQAQVLCLRLLSQAQDFHKDSL